MPPVVTLFLLTVLLTGFSVTNLTEDWLWTAPYHDHMLLGRHLGHGHVSASGANIGSAYRAPRHAHAGDQLSRAFAALRAVEPPVTDPAASRAATSEGARRVVSTWSPSAGTADPGSFTLVLALAVLLVGLASLQEGRLLAPPYRQANGRFVAPLVPPPQAA